MDPSKQKPPTQPFGTQDIQSGSDVSPFRFQGSYTDSVTGFIYLINRYYDPATGQFISVDPDVMDTGQPYAFTGDDPLNETDPLGLTSNSFLKWLSHQKRSTRNYFRALARHAATLNAADSLLRSLGRTATIAANFGSLSLKKQTAVVNEIYNDATEAVEEAGIVGPARASEAFSAATEGGGGGWTRVGRWMSPDEYENMTRTGVVQWNEQGVSRVLTPADPNTYRAAPQGDIYAEYDVPSDVLSGHSAGTSIIYGPDSFAAKAGLAVTGDVPVDDVVIPDL